jgi:hypothetical protein
MKEATGQRASFSRQGLKIIAGKPSFDERVSGEREQDDGKKSVW